MAWQFKLDGVSLAEEDAWTAGEWETLWVLANRRVAHAETDIDPLHCPSCRIAIAAFAFATAGISVASAIDKAMSLDAGALVDAFTIEAEE